MPCLKCSLICLTLEKDFDIKQVMNKTSTYLVTELVGMWNSHKSSSSPSSEIPNWFTFLCIFSFFSHSSFFLKCNIDFLTQNEYQKQRIHKISQNNFCQLINKGHFLPKDKIKFTSLPLVVYLSQNCRACWGTTYKKILLLHVPCFSE